MKVEIEQALEKENLDRERGMAGEEAGSEKAVTGSVKSSTSLLGDMEDIRQKVERFHKRRDLEDNPLVREKGEAVVLCYKSVFPCLALSFGVSSLTSELCCRSNPTTPLDCWRAVSEFKVAATQVEQVRTVF